MKICPVVAKLLRVGGRTEGQTDRQTDMTKLTITLSNFVNAPECLPVNVVYRNNHYLFSESYTIRKDLCRQNGKLSEC
jgi:hypothetical protein